MPDYNIRINTQATGDGAKKTADGLKEVTAEVDKTSVSKGKLAQAAQKLAQQFPAVGAAADFLRHPLIGLAGVIALVIYRIGQQLEAIKRQEEAMRRLAIATSSATNPVRTFATSSAEAAARAEEFAVRLADIDKNAGGAAENLKEMNNQINRQQRMADELADSQMAEELAKIDLAEARGEISGPQAVQARGQTRLEFASAKAAREEAALDHKAKLEFAAASGDFYKSEQARRALPGARTELDIAIQKDAEAKKKFAGREQLRAAQEADAKKDIDEADAILSSPGLFGQRSDSEIQEARRRRAGGQATLDHLAIARDKDKASLVGPAAALKTANARYSQLESDAESFRKQANEEFSRGQNTTADLGALRSANDARLGSQASVGGMEAEIASLKAQNALALEALRENGRVQQEMAKELQRTNSRLENMHGR